MVIRITGFVKPFFLFLWASSCVCFAFCALLNLFRLRAFFCGSPAGPHPPPRTGELSHDGPASTVSYRPPTCRRHRFRGHQWLPSRRPSALHQEPQRVYRLQGWEESADSMLSGSCSEASGRPSNSIATPVRRGNEIVISKSKNQNQHLVVLASQPDHWVREKGGQTAAATAVSHCEAAVAARRSPHVYGTIRFDDKSPTNTTNLFVCCACSHSTCWSPSRPHYTPTLVHMARPHARAHIHVCALTQDVYAMTMISFNFSTMFALAFVALQVITMPDAVDGADYTCVSRRKQTRLTPHTAMTHT